MTPFFVSFLRYDVTQEEEGEGRGGPSSVRSSSAFVSSAGGERQGQRLSGREVTTIDIRYVRSGNARSCRTRCSLRNRLAYPTLRRSRQGSGNFLAGRFCVFDCPACEGLDRLHRRDTASCYHGYFLTFDDGTLSHSEEDWILPRVSHTRQPRFTGTRFFGYS